VLYNIGGRTVSIGPADWPKMGGHSGFLTLGDNNSQADQLFSTPLSSLVKPGWVIGVARGMIPWFGALKLLLDGNSAKVPPASWEYLGLTVAGVIFAAAGLHFLLRRRRELRLGRRGRYDEDEEADLDEAPRARRSSTGLRAWKAEDEPPPSTGRPAPHPARRLVSHEERRRSHFVSSREYRPARRHNKEEPRTPKDDDDEGT